MQTGARPYLQRAYILKSQQDPNSFGRLETDDGSKLWYRAEPDLDAGTEYLIGHSRLDSEPGIRPVVHIYTVTEVTDP